MDLGAEVGDHRRMTFSILAVSPDGACLGVATAAPFLCVGRSVPALAPGVGAIATQGWTSRAFRPAALQALRRGATPREALRDLDAMDLAFQSRQVGLLTASGAGSAHTGSDTASWSGSIVEPGLVVVGEGLAGPEVLRAIARQFGDGAARPGTDFATLLVDCLLAGDAAGGDQRGRQSAAVMTVPSTVPDTEWPELDVDLRIDDNPDPVTELAVLLSRWRAEEDAG